MLVSARDNSTYAHLRFRPDLHRFLHHSVIISRYEKLPFCPRREIWARMHVQQQLRARDVAADAAEEAALMNNVVALIPMSYVHADSSGLEFDCIGTRCNVLQYKRLGAKDVARKLRSPPLVAAVQELRGSLLAPTVRLVVDEILPRAVNVTVILHSAGVVIVFVHVPLPVLVIIIS